MGGVSGTGVIAGVAQTALQAQQLARRRDKQVRDAKRLAQHQLEVQRMRVESLEENDAAEDATRIRIDSHVPEHEHRELLETRRRRDNHTHTADEDFSIGSIRLPGPLPLRVDTRALTNAKSETKTDDAGPASVVPQSARLATTYHHHRTKGSASGRLDIEG